jgi:hypothetical protein
MGCDVIIGQDNSHLQLRSKNTIPDFGIFVEQSLNGRRGKGIATEEAYLWIRRIISGIGMAENRFVSGGQSFVWRTEALHG